MSTDSNHYRVQDARHPRGHFPYAAPAGIPKTIGRDCKHVRKDALDSLRGSFVSSNLRAPFLAPNLQPKPSHALAHSCAHVKNITLAFPVASPLFVRSFAKERKSTPLFSCVSALFCRNGGYPKKSVNFLYHFPNWNKSDVSHIAANSNSYTLQGGVRPVAALELGATGRQALIDGLRLKAPAKCATLGATQLDWQHLAKKRTYA
jgi:hypothetical protein